MAEGGFTPPEIPEGISRKTMQDLPLALVLADAQAEDMPIVYVNSAFERVTGYSRSVVLGQNCRFLQGPETSPDNTRRIREALREEREITLDLVNYRANGEKFINRLMITPIRDERGDLSHFLGIQSEQDPELTMEGRARKLDESLRELQHRVKNHLAMLLALIRMEARRDEAAKRSLDTLASRVESLNLLYDEFSRHGTGNGEEMVSLGAYVSRVCAAMNMLDGMRNVVVNIDADNLKAPLETASQVGLLVSELLTNALQHAFPEGRGGQVTVRLSTDPESDVTTLEVSDNGTGLPADLDWPASGNLGSRIVRDLSTRLEGELVVRNSEEGLTVTVAMPGKVFHEIA